MASERIRNLGNLPPKTRQAIAALDRACSAARALADVPAPTARGQGKELVDREVGGLRERVGLATEGAETLDHGLRSPYRLLVVGPSQAGKSTLINVIAGHRLLPTTGAGDAKTLKETVLTYSSEADQTLRVRYITKREANERRFVLERHARAVSPPTDFVGAWKDLQRAESEPDDADSIDPSTDEDRAAAVQAKHDLGRRNDMLIEQIKALTYPELRRPRGSDALLAEDREALVRARKADWVDGWRILLGQQLVAGGRYAARWEPRLAPVRALLGSTVEIKAQEIGRPTFLKEVERHTAEGLAFLVDRVELALPGENLEHMDVEDLPGVGNFGDPAADVARDVLAQAMRERDLDGLLVVTHQNGIDQGTADLVAEAAVLRRVLQGETDLGIAVTHVDQIAEAQLDEGTSEHEISQDAELRRAGDRAAANQLDKLRSLLEKESQDTDEQERSARIRAVLDRTRIEGVDAFSAEVHRFDIQNKKKKAFASNLEATGVPRLIAHFRVHAQSRHDRWLARVLEQCRHIATTLDAELEHLARDNDVGEAQKLASAARTRYLAVLKASQLPLSNRWTAIRERTESRLQDRVAGVLPSIELAAVKEAGRKKRAIIRGCETKGPNGGRIHWATMKAALSWGGTWAGAHHLDLPGDLATALMPVLLKGWQDMRDAIRQILKEFFREANVLLQDLEKAANSASVEAGIAPSAAATEEARRQLQANLKSAETILEADLDNVTTQVGQTLRAHLKGHFETECAKVLKRHPHGRSYPGGYTTKLLQAYDDIGAEAIDSGAAEGTKILRDALRKLQAQIKKTLFGHDPVVEAHGRLTSGIHDASEPAEVVEARASLSQWARERQAWLRERLIERKRLFEKFTVLEDIRVGGMSRGYKIEDAGGRVCFLKAVDKHGIDERALKRELEIYDRLSRKSIDGVLELLDWGETENEAYIVLPWAEGGTLDAVVPGHGMDLSEVARLGGWVAEVVTRLHEADVVHRDIKPENILKRGDGWALGDFGIAKNLRQAGYRGTVRGSGSPGYAPPEQIDGHEPARSMDVYAVGKLICFLATGQTDRDKAIGYSHFKGTNLHRLMLDCTKDEPDARPTITEVVQRIASA